MSDFDAHLLIVDDDERIRELLKKFLMRHGFLVTAARDAAQEDIRRMPEGALMVEPEQAEAVRCCHVLEEEVLVHV